MYFRIILRKGSWKNSVFPRDLLRRIEVPVRAVYTILQKARQLKMRKATTAG